MGFSFCPVRVQGSNSIVVFAGFHWISSEGMTLPSTSTPASRKTTRKSLSAIPNSKMSGGRRRGQLPGFHLKLENPSRYQKNPSQHQKHWEGLGNKTCVRTWIFCTGISSQGCFWGNPPHVLPWLSLQHLPSSSDPSCSSSCPGHKFSPLLVSPRIMKPSLFTVVLHSGWTGFCNVFSLLAALHQVFSYTGGSHCGVLL